MIKFKMNGEPAWAVKGRIISVSRVPVYKKQVRFGRVRDVYQPQKKKYAVEVKKGYNAGRTMKVFSNKKLATQYAVRLVERVK